LTCIISVPAPTRSSRADKAKLGSTSMKTLVQRATNERLGDWLERPDEANKIVKKAIAASQARMRPRRPET